MQGSNGDTDVENRLVNTVREGKSEMNGKTSINIYTRSNVKWIAGEKLLYNTGSPVWHSVMTWKSVMRREGRHRGRGYLYNYGLFTLLHSRNQHIVIIKYKSDCIYKFHRNFLLEQETCT